MIKRDNIKIILFFSCFLIFQQNINANGQQTIKLRGYKTPPVVQQDSESSNTDKIQSPDSSSNTDENTNKSIQPQQPAASSNPAEKPQTSINTENKQPTNNDSNSLQDKKQNNSNFDITKFGFNQSKPTEKKEDPDSNDTAINNLLNQGTNHKFNIRNYLNLTTLMTVLGVLGTFFGLFSSWLIYHLNKKNSNPLVIDRKNSALKYIEELYKIKEFLKTDDKIEVFGSLVENIQNPDQFNNLIAFYDQISTSIIEIPIISIHDRYKKHIKGKKYRIFESLVSSYTQLEQDKNIEKTSALTEENIREWQSKLEILLALQKNTDKSLKILSKDLR